MLGNNLTEQKEETGKSVDSYETEVIKVDVGIRINNTFVNADKKHKLEFSNGWVDFLNYLMNENRNLMSLLVDVDILAVSDSYALIQSKQDNINDLINANIYKVEKLYANFTGKDYHFAAVNEKLWEKEVEKYRFNLKNKIKYIYMEEKTEEIADSESDVSEEINDVEELVKSVFDSYEVK